MNKFLIQTDELVLKKRKLTIYRVSEPNTAILLWTSKQHAIHYVQRRHIQRLLANKNRQ